MTAATVLPAAGVRVVGAVLWLSAVAKAVAPRGFAAHLERLAPLPERLAVAIAVTVVVGEAALAMPLIVAAGPPAAEVAALILMAALSIVTMWAWRLGRIEECGCYGPFLRLSPPVSGAINLAMIVLLATGLTVRNPAATVRYGVLAWATGAGVPVVVAVLALPRFIGPIAAGRAWPSRWLPEVKIASGMGDQVVAFLDPACHRCRVWSKTLRILSAKPGFPAISVVSAGAWKVGAGPGASQLSAVVVGVVRLWLLNVEVPMAVVVRGGRIVEVWREAMPLGWVELLRR